MEKLFGIWLTASTEAAVRQNVLMDKRHFSAVSVKICYDLTAGTMWLSGPSWTWVTLSDELFVQVAGIDFAPVSALVKHRAYFRGSDNLTCLRAMPEPTLQDVQRYLANYLNGEISLSQFRDWFDTETWDLDMQPDTSLGQMVGEIELRLAEFTSGHRTEDDLRYHLESLLPKADNADFQLPIKLVEPSVEMISS